MMLINIKQVNNLVFSIIIPAKNEEVNINLCLDSIAELDYVKSSFEVLVIDNGSTDSTVETSNRKGAITFIQPDLTIAGLRNYGTKQASGRFFAFLDADCTVSSDWLKSATRWLDQKDISCFGAPPEAPENGTWVQNAWFLVRGKKNVIEDVDWLESMNMFVRKEIFESVGGFDESLQTCEDYDLSLRLKEQGRIISDRRIRTFHHGEASSLGNFYRKESWRGISNLKGVMRHGIRLREVPSLLLPVVHLGFVLYFIVAGMTALLGFSLSLSLLIVGVLMWQLPLLSLAIYKGRDGSKWYLRFALFLLLNIYFLARARAMLRFRN